LFDLCFTIDGGINAERRKSVNTGKSILALTVSIVAIFAVALLAFQTGHDAAQTAVQSSTPYPTYTPYPSNTPLPSPTVSPTPTQSPEHVLRQALLAEGLAPQSTLVCDQYQDSQFFITVMVCRQYTPGMPSDISNTIELASCLTEDCLQVAEILIPRIWTIVAPGPIADWFAQVNLRNPPQSKTGLVNGHYVSAGVYSDPDGSRTFYEFYDMGTVPGTSP
jgi:hypothetical protein